MKKLTDKEVRKAISILKGKKNKPIDFKDSWILWEGKWIKIKLK